MITIPELIRQAEKPVYDKGRRPSDEALYFQYGFQDLKRIVKKFDRNRNEEKKVNLYQELTSLGLQTDRENFQRIFEDLNS